MAAVRQGLPTEPVAAEETPDGLAWHHDGSGFAVALDPAPARRQGDRLTWTATLAPGTSVVVRLDFTAEGEPAFGPGGTPPWSERTAVVAPDLRLSRLAAQSLADLGGLLMRDGDDAFVAAGSPWFLTLFGRDSLWVARLLMPYGTGLAMSTLRTLARRQGERIDAESEEQPGKILHEVRNTTLELGGMSLPPVYYGTVDATPLFVCTLADAWRWGADPDEVGRAAARRTPVPGVGGRAVPRSPAGCATSTCPAGAWPTRAGRTASTRCSSPTAGSRTRRSRSARCRATPTRPPCARAELLAAFGEEPVEGLADWAADLRERFGREFWVDTEAGGHVAIALDGSGAPGRLGDLQHGPPAGHRHPRPRTGSRAVVEVLTGPDMASGFGLRTLTDAVPALLAAELPRRLGVAARHRGRGPGPGRSRAASRRPRSSPRGWSRPPRGSAYRLPELYGGDPAPASEGCPSRPTTRPPAARRPGPPPPRWPAWPP